MTATEARKVVNKALLGSIFELIHEASLKGNSKITVYLPRQAEDAEILRESGYIVYKEDVYGLIDNWTIKW